ncbi:ABC transporter permease [Sorangium cellulosum]|uniref:Sugar ABC transporter permease n=1 Tax=Sorangium cellulosum TaxID=56 RepID=A0A150QX00_SORCE|nr:ABC transporter permease [Sorangium cellulosum]KYF72510.1 sugar ABC transporter permease [Sorangium cellulosum]
MPEKISEALRTNASVTGVGIILFTAGVGALLLKRGRREAWPMLGLSALLVFNFFLSKNFFSIVERDGAYYGTPINLLNQGSEVMLLAIGLTLVIAVRGIDLSVSSVMALSGATCVILMKDHQYPPLVAALVSLLVAGGAGLFNGALVTLLNIQPIIVTLISMIGIRGVAMLITNAEPVTHVDATFAFIGNGHLGGLPFSMLLVAVVFAIAALLSRKTALGLFMEAIGDNERASHLAGVSDRRIKLCLYGFSGLCAGIAGLVAASYISTADPDRVGRLRELDAIFAVVIGGTALTGGRFYLGGTLVGALLIQTLSITMYSQHVPSEIEPMPKAIVMLMSCLLISEESRRRLVALFGVRRWQ